MLGRIFTLITCSLLLVHIQPIIANNENPIVTTSLGQVKGAILTSIQGKSIYSFRGIRYAEAPINELRFKPPVRIDKWIGTYDATHDGPSCPQPGITPISEDCLFLNVYSTKLPEGTKNPKRPVIFFIHPGGFYSSTSSSNWGGPQYFMDQDIVFVTINYRLGSLGFMSTGDELSPGNNGLKDQVVALKWVQEHIAAFGGDPDLVTICGYSAGGFSVSLHLLSPMSQGLFHKAIIMSASTYGQWPVPTHQFHLAQKQARLVGCPDDTSANIINCLKTKSAEELANSLRGFAEFRFDPILIWSPVVEPDFGQERFLTDDPKKLAQCGRFDKVPIMAGISRDEFASPAVDIAGNATLLKEMDDNWEKVAPISFLYERDTENSKHISRELRKFYLGEGPLDSSALSGLAKLYADGVTGFEVYRAVMLLSPKNNEHVYYYRFNFEGRYSHFYLPNTTIPYGIHHHDELIYMFYISPLFPKFNVTDPEYVMVKKLTTLLRNFAYTGNPTPDPTPKLDNVQWQPFDCHNKKYLDIGKKLIMSENLYQDRYSLWEKLFPLPGCHVKGYHH